jgi:hypothetical protein
MPQIYCGPVLSILLNFDLDTVYNLRRLLEKSYHSLHFHKHCSHQHSLELRKLRGLKFNNTRDFFLGALATVSAGFTTLRSPNWCRHHATHDSGQRPEIHLAGPVSGIR